MTGGGLRLQAAAAGTWAPAGIIRRGLGKTGFWCARNQRQPTALDRASSLTHAAAK